MIANEESLSGRERYFRCRIVVIQAKPAVFCADRVAAASFESSVIKPNKNPPMRVVFCLNKDYYCNKIGESFNFVTLKEHTKIVICCISFSLFVIFCLHNYEPLPPAIAMIKYSPQTAATNTSFRIQCSFLLRTIRIVAGIGNMKIHPITHQNVCRSFGCTGV